MQKAFDKDAVVSHNDPHTSQQIMFNVSYVTCLQAPFREVASS